MFRVLLMLIQIFILFSRTHQPGSKVEISELTWEQKEHVLRLLFAKMNGQSLRY